MDCGLLGLVVTWSNIQEQHCTNCVRYTHGQLYNNELQKLLFLSTLCLSSRNTLQLAILAPVYCVDSKKNVVLLQLLGTQVFTLSCGLHIKEICVVQWYVLCYYKMKHFP